MLKESPRETMPEDFFPNPELLADDEILNILKIIFCTKERKPIIKRLKGMNKTGDPNE